MKLSPSSLTLPNGISSGNYSIKWNLKTLPVITTAEGYSRLTVTGSEAALNVATDRTNYNPDQNVLALANVNNTAPYLLDGNLNLSITKLTSTGIITDDWPCVGGNNGRTGWTKLSGNINQPFVSWGSFRHFETKNRLYPLVGNVSGDSQNEFIELTGYEVQIIDVGTGDVFGRKDLRTIFSGLIDVTAALLIDVNNDGYQEIIFCADGRFVAALNGKLETLWTQTFTVPVLNNPFMAAADLNNDKTPELLLSSVELNALTGTVIKTGTTLGSVADLDNDGKLEIISTDAVLDSEFRVIAARSGNCNATRYPVVSDINQDGAKELVLFDTSGVYVYNHHYQPIWSYPITGLETIAVADINLDGKEEIIGVQVTIDSANYYANSTSRLVCFAPEGRLVIDKALAIKSPNLIGWPLSLKGQKAIFEICSLAVSDINNDNQMEIIAANNWNGLTVYNAEGDKLWDIGDYRIISPPAIADIDGDHKAEILVREDGYYGFICIDDSLRQKDLKDLSVWYPTNEIEITHSVSSWENALVLPNGDLLIGGNHCVIYYRPASNSSELIPILTPVTDLMTLRLGVEGVEVWDKSSQKLLGVINPATMIYTPKPLVTPYKTFNPLMVRNGYYYTLKYNYNQRKYEIIRENIQSGEKQSLGFAPSSYNRLIAVLDETTLLLSYYDYYNRKYIAGKLLLNGMTVVPTEFLFPYSSMVRLNDTNLLYVNNNNLVKYDSVGNKSTVLTSLERIISYLVSLGYSRGDGINISFIPKDGGSIYIVNDPYYKTCPWLLQYTLATDELTNLTKLRDYGKIVTACAVGSKIYFTCKNTGADLYIYDRDSRITQIYPAPQEIRLNSINRISIIRSPSGKLSLIISGYDGVSSQIKIADFNPVTNTWVGINNYGTKLGYDFSSVCYGESDDIIYIDSMNQILKLFKSSGITQKCDEGQSVDGIFYDESLKQVFYILDYKLKAYDPVTGNNNLITEINRIDGELIGAKDGNLFLGVKSCFRSNTGDFTGENFMQYSLNEKKFSPLFVMPLKSMQEDLDLPLSWEWPASWEGYFDAENMKYSAVISNCVFEFDLAEVPMPVDEGTKTQEVIVKQETLPLQLEANTTQGLQKDFGPISQPGTYTLKGKLTNSLGQILAQDQKQFVVKIDNGFNVSIGSDKLYYRPNEMLNLSGQLTNTTATAVSGLKLTVIRSGNGPTTILKEEVIALAAGETKAYNLTANLGQAEGEALLEVKLAQAGIVVAQSQILITVVKPSIQVELDAPVSGGSQPVPIKLKLTNTSPYPVSIYLESALMQLAQPVALNPNEVIYITKDITMTSDVNLVVTLSGDLNAVYQKEINYNQNVNLAITLPELVSNNTRSIPYSLSNNGQVGIEIPITLDLYREGIQVAQGSYQLYLEAGRSLVGSWPIDLTFGNYYLVATAFNQTKEFSFTCLPEYEADFTATAQQVSIDQLKLTLNAQNKGCQSIDGNIIISADFTQQSIPVTIAAGTAFNGEITLNNLPFEAGNYPIIINLEAMGQILNSQTLNFTRVVEVPPVAVIEVTSVPINLIGGAGQELSVVVKVKNTGTKNGDGIVEIIAESLTFVDSQVVNLNPGQEQDLTFKVLIPDELESGSYQAQVTVNGKTTNLTFQVNGYKLKVIPSLDKAAYQKGETAILSLQVQNLGGQNNIPLYVRVKHGEFDETREITLSQNTTLTFSVPAEPFDQKIFFGFYHVGTGRSLLMDVRNIYETLPELKVTLNKERYQSGETVQFNVNAIQPGWLAIAGPGDFYRFEEVNGVKSYAIPLPASLITGTYSIWVAFADQTLEYKIDVLGDDVRYVSGSLDKPSYQNDDQFNLKLLLTSREAFDGNVLLELVKPDQSGSQLINREINMTSGENTLNFTGVIATNQIGTHWLRLKVLLGNNVISTQELAFKVGKEELLNIITEQESYFTGTETVNGKFYLFGQGNGTVTVSLDGKVITSQNAILNGNTEIPFSLSGSQLQPGLHTLSAIYSSNSGGISGTVSTKFDYGIGLPDLIISNLDVAKERNANGELPIRITVQKIRSLPAGPIPVQVKIDNETISNYIIDNLTEVDATHQQVVNWNTGEFSGSGVIEVVVNAGNQIREYTIGNNCEKSMVVIPKLPQVDFLPSVSKETKFTISGQTSPGALVLLQDNQGVLDFCYADGSGGFNLTNFSLNQGQNFLRLVARSREGWYSGFTQDYQVMVDSVPPQIDVFNLNDGQFFNYDFTPEIQVSEINPAQEVYTMDGQNWVTGTPVSAEGNHQLYVKVTDIAGNEAESRINFVVDKTVPQVSVTGLTDGCYYNVPLTPTINTSDQNMATVEITLNGVPYQGQTITEDGAYSLDVLAVDKAGNSTEQQYFLTIDQTKPVIEVSGIAPGMQYKESVSAVINVIELNPESLTVLLDGQPYQSGSLINTNGSHRLTITAVDKAGNSEIATIDFLLDQIPPVTTVQTNGTKWSNGEFKSDVTVTLMATDNEGGTGVAAVYYKLGVNGSTIQYQGPFTITQSGLTELYYYTVDKINNPETPQKVEVRIVRTWAPSHTLICNQLKASGNVTVDRIFSNGSVTLNGNGQFNYLGASSVRNHEKRKRQDYNLGDGINHSESTHPGLERVRCGYHVAQRE